MIGENRFIDDMNNNKGKRMNRRTFLKAVPVITLLAGTKSGFGQELKTIELMEPQKDGGKSVLAALWERKTIRNISSRKLPAQMLSNLLWAAFGINRQNEPKGGPGRTAASAANSQEIDLYVVLPDGAYLYEAKGHRLNPVAVGDFRTRSGRGAMATAPVNIFYVVDIAKYAKGPFREAALKNSDELKSYYYVATGLIAQNVYLYAASQGLAAFFHTCDTINTSKEFKLRPEQHVLYAQAVGYSAD